MSECVCVCVYLPHFPVLLSACIDHLLLVIPAVVIACRSASAGKSVEQRTGRGGAAREGSGWPRRALGAQARALWNNARMGEKVSDISTRNKSKEQARGRAAEGQLDLCSLLVHARCMLRCRMAEWKHESMRKNQAYGPPGSLSSRRSVSTPCLNASCPLRAAATCTKSRGVDTRSTCRGRNGHRHLADQHTHTRAGRGAEDWRTRTLTAAHTATARRPAATTARREDVACRVDRWST